MFANGLGKKGREGEGEKGKEREGSELGKKTSGSADGRAARAVRCGGRAGVKSLEPGRREKVL